MSPACIILASNDILSEGEFARRGSRSRKGRGGVKVPFVSLIRGTQRPVRKHQQLRTRMQEQGKYSPRLNASFSPTYLGIRPTCERIRVIKGPVESSNNEHTVRYSCSIVAIRIRVSLPIRRRIRSPTSPSVQDFDRRCKDTRDDNLRITKDGEQGY